MRELVTMAEAKRKESWEHTSALMALVAGALTGKECKPSDFNPYADKKHRRNKRLAENTSDLSILANFGFKEVKRDDGKR